MIVRKSILLYAIVCLSASICYSQGTSASFNANIRLEAVNLAAEGGVFFQDAPVQKLSVVGFLTDEMISCYCKCDAGYQFLIRYNSRTNRSLFWSRGMVRQFGPHAGNSSLGASTIIQAILPSIAVGRLYSERDFRKKEEVGTFVTRMYSSPLSYEGSPGKTFLLHELTNLSPGNYSMTAYAWYDAGGLLDESLLLSDETLIYKMIFSASSLKNQNPLIIKEWESTHYAYDVSSERQAPFLRITGSLASFNIPAQRSHQDFLKMMELMLWPYEPEKNDDFRPDYSWKRFLLPEEPPLH